MKPKRSVNLVVCIDGTRGKPSSNSSETNVVKIYENLANFSEFKNKDVQQIKFYSWGLGSQAGEGKLAKIEGFLKGGLGHEMKMDVMRCYYFLMNNFHVMPIETNIFIFGFSRGAYVARCLANLVAHRGILKNKKEMMKLFSTKPSEKGAFSDNNLFHRGSKHSVKFLGLFDTVKASVDKDDLKFLSYYESGKRIGVDQDYVMNIGKIYHAISINEKRTEVFKPLFKTDISFEVHRYDAEVIKRLSKAGKYQAEYCWGCHSDIGGGIENPKSDVKDENQPFHNIGLSTITLIEMMIRSNKVGLQFQPFWIKRESGEEINITESIAGINEEDDEEFDRTIDWEPLIDWFGSDYFQQHVVPWTKTLSLEGKWFKPSIYGGNVGMYSRPQRLPNSYEHKEGDYINRDFGDLFHPSVEILLIKKNKPWSYKNFCTDGGLLSMCYLTEKKLYEECVKNNKDFREKYHKKYVRGYWQDSGNSNIIIFIHKKNIDEKENMKFSSWLLKYHNDNKKEKDVS